MNDGARLDGSSHQRAARDTWCLTEPVAIRVYTHFLYETFELPRGCMPAEFDVLVTPSVPTRRSTSAGRTGTIEISDALRKLCAVADLRTFDGWH